MMAERRAMMTREIAAVLPEAIRLFADVVAEFDDSHHPAQLRAERWVMAAPERAAAWVVMTAVVARGSAWTPDALRGWAITAAPRKPRGWRP